MPNPNLASVAINFDLLFGGISRGQKAVGGEAKDWKSDFGSAVVISESRAGASGKRALSLVTRVAAHTLALTWIQFSQTGRIELKRLARQRGVPQAGPTWGVSNLLPEYGTGQQTGREDKRRQKAQTQLTPAARWGDWNQRQRIHTCELRGLHKPVITRDNVLSNQV